MQCREQETGCIKCALYQHFSRSLCLLLLSHTLLRHPQLCLHNCFLTIAISSPLASLPSSLPSFLPSSRPPVLSSSISFSLFSFSLFSFTLLLHSSLSLFSFSRSLSFFLSFSLFLSLLSHLSSSSCFLIGAIPHLLGNNCLSTHYTNNQDTTYNPTNGKNRTKYPYHICTSSIRVVELANHSALFFLALILRLHFPQRRFLRSITTPTASLLLQ